MMRIPSPVLGQRWNCVFYSSSWSLGNFKTLNIFPKLICSFQPCGCCCHVFIPHWCHRLVQTGNLSFITQKNLPQSKIGACMQTNLWHLLFDMVSKCNLSSLCFSRIISSLMVLCCRHLGGS